MHDRGHRAVRRTWRAGSGHRSTGADWARRCRIRRSVGGTGGCGSDSATTAASGANSPSLPCRSPSWKCRIRRSVERIGGRGSDSATTDATSGANSPSLPCWPRSWKCRIRRSVERAGGRGSDSATTDATSGVIARKCSNSPSLPGRPPSCSVLGESVRDRPMRLRVCVRGEFKHRSMWPDGEGPTFLSFYSSFSRPRRR